MLLMMLFCPQLYSYISYHKCDIVLAQDIEACVMYFLHENIKSRLTGYGKN